MRNSSGQPVLNAARELRHALVEADDQKIRRITAMLDEVSDTAGKQAILDPLRDRLGSLRPLRPPRFIRLLFTPVEPLIVPPRAWRPGDATIPRSALASLCAVVRDGFGAEASVIDTIVAGHKTDAIQVITAAGEALWPRAAEILALSSAPAEWENTGLRPTFFPPLAKAMAAVLRRAPRLRSLSLDEAMGALEPNRQAIDDIVRNIADEPAEGCAMIAQLILLQTPRAVPLLWQCVSSVRNIAEKALLQQATARGMELVLDQIESPSGIMDEIARAPLAAVGDPVRRIATFLREMGAQTAAPAHRGRLHAIREKLDQTCRARFADGIAEGLVQPLAAASGQWDGADQTQLEICARDLRTLETLARKVGGTVNYDQLLLQASETVQAAAKAGTLTQVRKFRLIEILSGSEVASAMYRKATAGP
jgi:hypothetical protein